MRSLRDIFRRLPENGEVRAKLRSFNLAPHASGKARSVKELAESLGLSVLERPMRRGHNGCLERDAFSDSGFAIVVNQRLSVCAKRFALLHELGHYLMHADHEDYFAAPENFDLSGETFYWNEAQEREANRFAETLLFGDGALEAARSLHGNEIGKLARVFGVTEAVMKIAMARF
jgi:Zn-dependent peptidase ImmA (M78 family)